MSHIRASIYRNELYRINKKIQNSFSKLKRDSEKKHFHADSILNDYNQFVLLLGEANYLAREIKRLDRLEKKVT